MKKIILFRHLPTEDDVSNNYTAHNSKVKFAPLKNELVQNAQDQLIQFISENNITQVFCSNNERGRATANIILKTFKTQLDLRIDQGLNNILQPEWSGLNQTDVEKTLQYKIWHSEPKRVIFVNGESLIDVEHRVSNILAKIDNNGALLISHTTPMQVILCKLLGIDLNRIWAFKFDHYTFSVVANDILLRYNAKAINDINFKELRY